MDHKPFEGSSNDRQKGLWSVRHIENTIGHNTWPQICGLFGLKVLPNRRCVARPSASYMRVRAVASHAGIRHVAHPC